MIHKINEFWSIEAPDDYVQVPLQGRDVWLEALRSGIYEKGRHTLCADDEYCCLGVLSKIQGRLRHYPSSWVDGDCPSGDGGGLYRSNPVYNVLGGLGTLPAGVKVMFGQERPVSGLNTFNTLSSVNDFMSPRYDNENFDVIIAVIEFCYSNLPLHS